MTAEQHSHQTRIIIVDDDRGTRESLEEILEDDYDVVCVRDGQTALRKIKEEVFDLVLLDLVMPGMDGIETLDRIKRHDRSIDVIMVSATDRAHEATASIKSGAYEDALATIASLRSTVDDFFDNVMVMAEDEKLKMNRVSLLREIAGLFESLADFSKIST